MPRLRRADRWPARRVAGVTRAEHLTHTEAAKAVAAWLLLKQRYQAATWEVGGPPVVTGTRTRPVPVRNVDGIYGWEDKEEEVRRGTQLDAVGVESRPDRKPGLAIVEVKVSRADLLADLRAGKMLRYRQLDPTKLYLAFTPAVIGLNPYGWPLDEAERPDFEHVAGVRRSKIAALVAELESVLPTSWGLLFVRRWSAANGRPEVDVIRAAKRQPAEALDVAQWVGRVAARYSYQALAGKG